MISYSPSVSLHLCSALPPWVEGSVRLYGNGFSHVACFGQWMFTDIAKEEAWSGFVCWGLLLASAITMGTSSSCPALHVEPHPTPRSHHCLGEHLPGDSQTGQARKHKSHWNLVAINNRCSTLFYPFLSLLMSLKVDNWLRGSLENFIFFYIDTFPT